MTILNVLAGKGIFYAGGTAVPENSLFVVGTTSDTQTEWIVPDGVTFCHIVCIGAGGGATVGGRGGGGGGGLRYINNYAVTPGQQLYVSAGGQAYYGTGTFTQTTSAGPWGDDVGGYSSVALNNYAYSGGSVIVQANGGSPGNGGTTSGTTGSVGFTGGGTYGDSYGAGGGGGAAGYRGVGGIGGGASSSTVVIPPTAGTVDGAGGGYGNDGSGGVNFGGGGGMSIYGSVSSGANGAAGTISFGTGGGGGGGSPGTNGGSKGSNGLYSYSGSGLTPGGGNYGGGSGSGYSGYSLGCVRIIWGYTNGVPRTGFPGPTTIA